MLIIEVKGTMSQDFVALDMIHQTVSFTGMMLLTASLKIVVNSSCAFCFSQ
jgi:hypothetical protein